MTFPNSQQSQFADYKWPVAGWLPCMLPKASLLQPKCGIPLKESSRAKISSSSFSVVQLKGLQDGFQDCSTSIASCSRAGLFSSSKADPTTSCRPFTSTDTMTSGTDCLNKEPHKTHNRYITTDVYKTIVKASP